MSDTREPVVESAWEDRAGLSPKTAPAEVRQAVASVIDDLDSGRLRVASRRVDADGKGHWTVHQWIKKAVLLSFRLADNQVVAGCALQYFDKVPTKFAGMSGVRHGRGRLPGGAACGRSSRRVHRPQRRADAVIRQYRRLRGRRHHGGYLGNRRFVRADRQERPSVGRGRDRWRAGTLQASPTIIEDNCFIGARSEVVEGVIVEENSVLAMGVFISQSTRIYERASGAIHYGRVPSGSVVVPGSLPSKDGTHSLACAVIVKRVDAQTRAKTAINDLLRQD